MCDRETRRPYAADYGDTDLGDTLPGTMPLISLILVIVVLGVVLYLIETYVPMSPPIRTVLRVVVVLAVVVWLLQILGVVGPTIGIR